MTKKLLDLQYLPCEHIFLSCRCHSFQYFRVFLFLTFFAKLINKVTRRNYVSWGAIVEIIPKTEISPTDGNFFQDVTTVGTSNDTTMRVIRLLPMSPASTVTIFRLLLPVPTLQWEWPDSYQWALPQLHLPQPDAHVLSQVTIQSNCASNGNHPTKKCILWEASTQNLRSKVTNQSHKCFLR